jgi:hypothetical protein
VKGLKSGWSDSNTRPPGPKPGAITGLRYTPNPLRRCKDKQIFILCNFKVLNTIKIDSKSAEREGQLSNTIYTEFVKLNALAEEFKQSQAEKSPDSILMDKKNYYKSLKTN